MRYNIPLSTMNTECKNKRCSKTSERKCIFQNRFQTDWCNRDVHAPYRNSNEISKCRYVKYERNKILPRLVPKYFREPVYDSSMHNATSETNEYRFFDEFNWSTQRGREKKRKREVLVLLLVGSLWFNLDTIENWSSYESYGIISWPSRYARFHSPLEQSLSLSLSTSGVFIRLNSSSIFQRNR